MKSLQMSLIGAALCAVLSSGCTPTTTHCDCAPAQVSAATVRYEAARWTDLEGWDADAVEEAWDAFLASCRVLIRQEAWAPACTLAQQDVAHGRATGARGFFERELAPYRVVYDDGRGRTDDAGLITGYYEPILRGARTRSATFHVPLYAPPDDMLTVDLGDLHPALKGQRVRGRLEGRRVVPYFDRAALESSPALRGKELLWVDDEIDAFFLQIQGSGRIRLNDGRMVRLAYADQNGHPYRSIGRYLVELGELSLEEASAPGIRQWLLSNPQRLKEVLNANPSVVFFREEQLDAALGPKGSLGVPLTAQRSLAVDRQFVPLGAPIFLATTYPDSTLPLQRLVVAQDTGGAIRGALRADFFWGTGDAAGEQAGRMRQSGRMWLLWPRGSQPST